MRNPNKSQCQSRRKNKGSKTKKAKNMRFKNAEFCSYARGPKKYNAPNIEQLLWFH